MLAAWGMALLIVFEEWGWVPLARLMGVLARLPFIAWLERRIVALPPRVALGVLFVPMLLLLPFKIGALWLIAGGRLAVGMLVFFGAKIVGTGIETSFEIEFTVRVLKGKAIGWPRGETADEIFAIGNARPLDQALQHATTEMLAWLGADFGLDPIAASHLLGQIVRYDVANVFNPAYSVACRVEKRWLEGRA